jgi:hypothetical protein
MKLSLSIIVGLLVLAGCGPAAKLKRAENLIRQAIAQGAKVDSLTKIVHDTIRVKETEHHFETIRLVDTVRLVEKCKELVKSPTKSGVGNLQKEICPEVAIDSAFLTTLTVQGKEVKVPIRVVLNVKEGHISGSLSVPAISIPFESEKTTVGVSSGYTLWGLIWRILVIGFIPGFAVCWVLKTFRII